MKYKYNKKSINDMNTKYMNMNARIQKLLAIAILAVSVPKNLSTNFVKQIKRRL